jgi:ketosteroid isomerase-like protein
VTASLDELLRRLQALEDRAAITDVLHRYAHGYRLRDPAIIASCFTDDAIIELGPGRILTGREQILRTYGSEDKARPSSSVFDQRLLSTPLIANVMIEVDGDRAHCESMCLAIHTGRRGDGSAVLVRGTLNIDDLARCADGWRIAHRRHPALWQFTAAGDPVPGERA